MNKKEKNIWDSVSKSYDVATLNLAAHKDKYNDILSIIFSENPKNIVDFGIGTGTLEYMLFEDGYSGTVTGIESSQGMIGLCEKKLSKYRESIKIIKWDLDKISSLELKESFDVVVMVNVLFYLKDAQKTLNYIKRILKKDGVLILVEPKPKGDISSFIRRQFREGLWGFLKLLWHLPSLVRVAVAQKDLDDSFRKGFIKFRGKKELLDMLKLYGMRVEFISETQAGENYLFKVKQQENNGNSLQ